MATITDDKSEVIPAANNQPTPEAVVATVDSSSSENPTDQVITIEVVAGDMTKVEAPVAVTGKYTGLDLAGATKTFDKLLDFWLTRRALEMGMIGSDLGQLFPINLKHSKKRAGILVDHILLMGMGVPSEFSPSDVRFLMRNVTVAVKSMGYDRMCVPLFGTRRKELPIDLAAVEFLQGIFDGCERFREIVDAVSVNKQELQTAVGEPLVIVLVEPDAEKAEQIYSAFQDLEKFKDLENDYPIAGVQLQVHRGEAKPADELPEARGQNQDAEDEGTLLRVTRNGQAAGASETKIPTDVFQFSAISGVAAVTVREVELSSYLMSELPKRMVLAANAKEREDLGKFFTSYVVPNDFRNFLEGAKSLTLVLDETTASFPWELAAFEKYRATKALGRSMCVSRRFHSLLSPPPSSPPPLNDKLKVLVIADPAPEQQLSLPGARREGWTVVEALGRARRLWEGKYEITADIRIGAPDSKARLEEMLARNDGFSGLLSSYDTCDPVEIAKLIVQEQYDVVHYAGHGVYDENHKRAGWVLHDKCLLSAQEIFRAREVPRLVFGNACYSAATSTSKNPQGQLVGLAQAFFARGIPNYIGTGWAVNDERARKCAETFYCTLLGLKQSRDAAGEWSTSTPKSIGAAMLAGRRAAYHANDQSSTWAAYQHYGRVSDRILCKT